MKNRTHFTEMLVILSLALSVVACSSDGGINQDVRDTANPETVDAIPPEIEHIVNPDREIFDGETLTIAVVFYAHVQPFAERYMRENPGVTIELITFVDEYENDGNYQWVREQIGTQLMAGSGPVLVQELLVNYLDPRAAHFFYDWFPLMNADPKFNEDDWFMNAFHAASKNGKLLSFPTMILYHMAAANSTIPGLAEALATYEGITIHELVELHRTYSTDEQYYFEPFSNLGTLVWHNLHKFLDFETGSVDFNNAQFIDLINSNKDLVRPDDPMLTGEVVWPRDELALSEKYSFFMSQPYQPQYFLDFEESLFTELTPIVNESGELIVYFLNSYILNANASPAQQALAWDFVRYMMQPENYSLPAMTRHPTNRKLLRHVMEKFLPINIDEFYESGARHQLNGTIEETVESGIAQMTAYGDMQMSQMYAYPDVIMDIVTENIRNFQDGLLSAEQTAANMQNQIELVMMEIGVQ